MRFLQQYKNLSREIYILFFGRIVTSMGSLIWPIMTLILKNKLGYSATTIATISMVMGIVQLPAVLLGGKVADTLNRKWVIICCDMVTVICFFISGIIPLSFISVVLFYVAGVFATIEGPSYDAIVADLSDGDSREHAYSLQYLGGNLGLVLAPTLGGLLFKHYLWLAFIITSLATFSSTVLIFLFVKRLQVDKKHVSEYEEKKEGVKLWEVLKERKTFFLYFIATGFAGLVYSQFNYLLPLNMENLYGADGATWFGMMTSINGFVVVVGTPLITAAFGRIKDVRKMVIGETLIVVGLFSCSFAGRMIPLYFLFMTVFTLGEIFNVLGGSPYMTRRIPSTHWGRVNSILMIFNGGFSAIGNLVVGKLVDTKGFTVAWEMIGVVGALAIGIVSLLALVDKKQFRLLYEK